MRIWDMNPIALCRSSRLLLIALLPLPWAVLRAEDSTPPPATRPAKAERNTISIDFPGGPFSKLVASLNREELSIIQSAGVDPVLPAFSVRDVRVESVIAALGRLLEPQGYLLAPVGPNLAALTKYERRSSQEFASFQLDRKLGDRSAEDVVAAIQQGCEFASEGKPSTLRFKYHPATKLLFVAGTEQEVGIAHRVFASLPDTPGRETATPTPSAKK